VGKTTMGKENRNNRGASINWANAEINFNKSLVAQNVFVWQTQDIDMPMCAFVCVVSIATICVCVCE